jgi:DNA-binding MarR family transcriptional regulator
MEPADFRKLDEDLRRGKVPSNWTSDVEGADPSTVLIMMWAGRLSRRVDAFYQKALRRHGLKYSDFSVLSILRFSGAVSPKQLNTTLAISSGGLTKAIQRLERKGLVKRAPDPEDGRGTLLSLTAKAERLIVPIFKENIEVHEKLFHGLSPRDRKRIASALRDLLDTFEETRGG